MNLLRSSWEDVTVSEWKELRELNRSEFDSATDYQIERLSIILDIDSGAEYWDKITAKEFTGLVEPCSWLNAQPSKKPAEKIKEYRYKGVSGVLLGEYIDLEHWHVEGFVDNIERIAATLYRKQKLGEWGEKIVEPYNAYSRTERAEEFSNIKIGEIYGVVVEFLNFRASFMKRYETLFNDDGLDDGLEEGTEIEEERKTIAGENEKDAEKKRARWSWEKLIFDMCDGDITKYETVITMPLVFVFNTLSMRADLRV